MPIDGVPSTAPASRVYAVGDIHGRRDLLARLHAAILADRAEREREAPGLRNVLVYVGDYVDRGPESFAVVDGLVYAPLPGFEIHCLKGNHEDLLIRFLADGSLGEAWMYNGGVATLESYGVDVFRLAHESDPLGRLRLEFRKSVPESHARFFAGLELRHEEGDYLFVHAGVRPGVPLDAQSEQDLLWIRHEFLASDADFGKVIVHGHSIQWEPDVRPNRIGIDTGAFHTGRLTCLVAEGAERRFLWT
jgi:serine/threonine protein phosphatase 1